MNWLSSPKVRLGLIVNGLYFISLFTPATRHTRPRLFAHAREPVVVVDSMVSPPAPAPPAYVPLAPPAAPAYVSAYESGDLLHVSLDKDLWLLRRPGRALLLSVNFSARTSPPEEPEYVYLSFHLYTDGESCPGTCPLSIVADNMVVVPSYTRSGPVPRPLSLSPGLQRGPVPQSSTHALDEPIEAQFLNRVNAKISYEQFNKVLGAQRIIISLGPDQIELNADQVKALRDMRRRVSQLTKDAPQPGGKSARSYGTAREPVVIQAPRP
jgi:hypothetical protein